VSTATIESVQLPTAGEATVLHGVEWGFYQSLRAELWRHGQRYRLAYDRGVLEIMSPSSIHEGYKKALARLLEALTEELGVPLGAFGSMTLDRADLNRGLEPDECYYIRNEPAVRGRLSVAIPPDPPPDLAIEVVVSGRLDKLPIYAALGVPEVWRFDGEELLSLHIQVDGTYQVSERSWNLPQVPTAELARFVHEIRGRSSLEWLNLFRAWVRDTLRPAPGGGEPPAP
jgi:Uma2 family endonuclease